MATLREAFTIWRTEILLFCAVFAVALGVQLSYWLPNAPWDEGLWITAISETVQEGIMRPAHEYGTTTVMSDAAFLYPSTTIIVPASALSWMGFSASISLRITYTLFMALIIALAVSVFRHVYPREALWMPVAILLVLGPFYQSATIPTAAMIPFITLIVLAFLMLQKRAATRQMPLTPLIFVGVLGGVSLATRLDVSVLIFGSGLVLLWFSLRSRVLVVALSAALMFVLLNPFLWFSVHDYFSTMHAIFGKTETFAVRGGMVALIQSLVLPFPLATLSFLLWFLTYLTSPRTLPVPPRFALWLFSITGLMAIVLLFASSPRLWYFHPFFALWEVLLPLIVVALVEAHPDSSRPLLKKYLIVTLSVLIGALYALPWVRNTAASFATTPPPETAALSLTDPGQYSPDLS